MDASAAELKITDWFVGLPLLHVGITIVYIYTYARVFGGNILGLVGTNDVANVAIQAMPVVYGLILLSVVGAVIGYVRSATPSTDAEKAKIRNSIIRDIALIIVVSALPLGLGVWRSYQDGGQPFNVPLAIPMTLALTVGLPCVVALFCRVPQKIVIAGTLVLVAFHAAAIQAADAAQHDKYARYSIEAKPLAQCKDKKILRSFADGYLAVAADNSKLLINKDCAVSLSVPTPEWWSKKWIALPKAKSGQRRGQTK